MNLLGWGILFIVIALMIVLFVALDLFGLGKRLRAQPGVDRPFGIDQEAKK